MRKLGTLALGVLVALGAATPAHATPQRHRYVAYDAHVVGLALLSRWTGVAMEGSVSFVPTSDHAVVHINDALAKGTVHVIVSSVAGIRHECMQSTGKTTLRGLVPNRPTYLYILDPTYKGNCATGGTTGTVTLG